MIPDNLILSSACIPYVSEPDHGKTKTIIKLFLTIKVIYSSKDFVLFFWEGGISLRKRVNQKLSKCTNHMNYNAFNVQYTMCKLLYKIFALHQEKFIKAWIKSIIFFSQGKIAWNYFTKIRIYLKWYMSPWPHWYKWKDKVFHQTSLEESPPTQYVANH